MPWNERSLRGTKIWAKTDAEGKLIVGADGRVDIKYKLGEGATTYRAAERNLSAAPANPDGAPAIVVPESPAVSPVVSKVSKDSKDSKDSRDSTLAPAKTLGGAPIIVYTDGACSGNPGPMGVGVVILRDGQRREIGEYLGSGTNNIAELTAVERALDAIPPADRERQVLVHTDSSYSIGVLAGGFKAKKNVELIQRLRLKCARFPRLRFVKVDGHAGVPENERCDQLARAAVARRA